MPDPDRSPMRLITKDGIDLRAGAERRRRALRPGAHFTDQVVAMPHFEGRGFFIPVHIPGLPDMQDVRVLNAGFSTDADGPGVSGRPPWHGEHTRSILSELGYSDAEVESLIAQGAGRSLRRRKMLLRSTECSIFGDFCAQQMKPQQILRATKRDGVFSLRLPRRSVPGFGQVRTMTARAMAPATAVRPLIHWVGDRPWAANWPNRPAVTTTRAAVAILASKSLATAANSRLRDNAAPLP